jgi:ureidoglycolate amidohydrolase
LPAVATGSHIDAIPNAGKYDGVVGVLGALEAIRGLRRAGFQPKRSIELIVFAGEEPTRFGLGCLGSRLLAGTLSPEQALELTDAEGKKLRDWLTETYSGVGDLRSVQ